MPKEKEEGKKKKSFYKNSSRAVARIPSRFGPDARHYRKQRSIMEFWVEWFDADPARYEDTFSERLFTAWRIVRETCVLRGVITEPGQTLAQATKVQPTPWENPFHFYMHESGDAKIDRICTGFELALHPPDPPERAVGQYLECRDKSLLAFIEMAEHVALKRLNVTRSRDGRIGIVGLLDPEDVRKAWPKPQEIMGYEEFLVAQIYETIVSAEPGGHGGEHAAREELHALGLNRHEIQQVFAMARAHAPEATGLKDPKAFIYMEMAKLVALADKQTMAGDLRGAAQTRRDILRILSVNSQATEEEDLDSVVEAEMRKEFKKKKRKTDEEDIIEA